MLVIAGTALSPAARAQSVGAVDEPIDPQRLRSAIDGGLDWLARQQVADAADAGAFAGGRYPVAVTSIAGLAFLAHGHLPEDERFGPVVRNALDYVMEQQSPDGYIGGESMYSHALASLFAFSYLGMCEDPAREVELAEWCARAIEPIVEAQATPKRAYEQGGWRYTPFDSESDVSVTSWQLLTLHAARQCGFDIDDRVIARGLRYVDSAWVSNAEVEGAFIYRPGASQGPEPGVTGAAMAIQHILQPGENERLDTAVQYLDQYQPSWGGPQYRGFFYFVSWYMAQGYFQHGEDAWRRFGLGTKQVLLGAQNGDGSWPFPPGARDQVTQTGANYSTAMALLLFGIDNQYLPMYQRQAALFQGE